MIGSRRVQFNEPATGTRPVTYVLGPEQGPTLEEVGGKAARLAALRSAGFQVPDWFVLSPRAFEASLTEAERISLEAARRGAGSLSLLSNIRLAGDVCADLSRALRSLCPGGERVAVRSSAFDEDDPQHSFAGQYATFLSLRPDNVPELVAAVWRSGFSEQVIAYRRARDLPFPSRPPAVLIQRQVDADVAGVAFGADPVSGRRAVAVVAAVHGLGSVLVSGEADGDTFRVSRDGRIVDRQIAVKRISHRPVSGAGYGIRVCPVPDALASRAAIDDARVVEVADLARRAGRHFGGPQDIEWAIERGQLYLLQSRPMTTLSLVADPDAVLNLWDNSNVAESYGGITLPLTFSFARHVYEEVYTEFCRLVGVPPRVIAAHHDTFARMLGLVRGRVYYNLLSWYRLLATLPGFTLNRAFMEQMMGVTERVPDEALGLARSTSIAAKALDAFRLGRTALGLAASHVMLSRNVKRFTRRLGEVLSAGVNFEDRRADELVADYRMLERQLLKRWDAPLVNDFFAMIFYGVLRRLTERWCQDGEGTLQNDLIGAEGGIISTEPARRASEMARLACADPALPAALCEGSLETIADHMARNPAFSREYEAYLCEFGDRCFEELKLESPTLADDPLPLLRTVGQRARGLTRSSTRGVDVDRAEAQSSRRTVRTSAEQRVQAALQGKPHRRIVLNWVLRQARARVRDRENLRFERTRVFGRVRRIFLALGRELVALGVLTAVDDIFYLHVDEVLGFVEGTAVTTDLKAVVQLRKHEYTTYREGPPPDDRFETRGIVYSGNSFRRPIHSPTPEGEERRGIGCCSGRVEGFVSVILDPRGARPPEGAILVAERTDPAWAVLFSTAAGVLVERGSVLSHSAIIAREMGIPTVMAIPGVTRWLRDGDRVQLDGRTGLVRRLHAAGEIGHAG